MHTILGAGGAIGISLAKTLGELQRPTRLVSRAPKAVNATDTLLPADLTQRDAIARAVAGSEVAYVTVGFPYSLKVWRAVWPPFIRNVVDACAAEGTKLVFFDNVYMLGKAHIGHITEDLPLDPPSKKGEVRAEVNRVIQDAMAQGRVQALIARSADFYGPHGDRSLLVESILKPLAQGKAPQWFCSVKFLHSFTYTPDAGRATALLGTTPDAFGQIWNLPTAAPATGEEWIRRVAAALGITPKKPQVLPAAMFPVLGLFIPILGEFYEMRYQYDRDYFFDSAKFEQRFGMAATPPEVALAQMVQALHLKK